MSNNTAALKYFPLVEGDRFTEQMLSVSAQWFYGYRNYKSSNVNQALNNLPYVRRQFQPAFFASLTKRVLVIPGLGSPSHCSFTSFWKICLVLKTCHTGLGKQVESLGKGEMQMGTTSFSQCFICLPRERSERRWNKRDVWTGGWIGHWKVLSFLQTEPDW